MSTTQEGKKECIFVLFEGFICCVWETACSLIYNIYTYILRHEVRSQPRCTYVWTTKTRHILNISRVSKYEFYEWVTYKFCAGTLFKPNRTKRKKQINMVVPLLQFYLKGTDMQTYMHTEQKFIQFHSM